MYFTNYRTNTVKDEKGDLITDGQVEELFQLLNVHGDNDVRQTEMHTAEPVVPDTITFEVEMAIKQLKRHIIRY